MGLLSEWFVVWLSTNVHTETSGQRGECGICTGERCSVNANNKELRGDGKEVRSGCALDECGKELIALHSCTKGHRQQDAKSKEEQIGWYESNTIGAHVFLSIA